MSSYFISGGFQRLHQNISFSPFSKEIEEKELGEDFLQNSRSVKWDSSLFELQCNAKEDPLTITDLFSQ